MEAPLRSRLIRVTAAGGFAALAGLSAGSVQAQDMPELTILTYASFVADWGPGPAIVPDFEAQCDCTVRFVSADDGVAILSRLRLEGAGTDIDIALGLDTNLVAEARDTGLFGDHGVDMSGLALPIDWTDPMFLPFDWGHFAFIYDTEQVEEPPASLDALINASDAEILIQDPRVSTPGLGLVLWMRHVFGDSAADAWTQLRPRIVTITAGWGESYGLFLEGEAPMVLSYTTSPAYHMLVEETDRYQAAVFDEGHYLQVEVAAVLAGSDQPDLAQSFLAYLVSADAQSAIPTTNWMFPVNPDAEVPGAFPDPASISPLLFDPETASAQRDGWTDEWLSAISQ